MERDLSLKSEIVELKKSTSELKEAIISISAMLNKHSKVDFPWFSGQALTKSLK